MITKTMLRKYARLIARVGANVQKKQGVVINADALQAPFATLVADECYKCGAAWVHINWSYQPKTKLDYRYRNQKTLNTVFPFEEAKLKFASEQLPCMIHILSEDPDGLKGVNREKVQKASVARYPIIKPYLDAMDNRYQWTIAAVPSPEWAKKVFPNDTKSAAVNKLWDAILKTVHITADNDPVLAWEQHNANFIRRSQLLNEAKFEYLEYKSANGTDFKVGLNPKGVWKGGKDTTLKGVSHNPNMPTEEIFTSPFKGKADGRLVSTKPLSYQGQLIENFRIDFKDGKAVDWAAEKNCELLGKMITADEGSCYIGEVALVPKESPINLSGIIFFNTLFDENATCHVALGRGFGDCLEGYESMTKEEQTAAGINDSMIHVDFMVGSDDMTIVGVKDGKRTEIFKNGTWTGIFAD